ncbi:transmembrane protease serine 7 isoform X1 [Prionailurus iriomotensis]
MTSLSTLGVALKFHNYSITKKSVKGCDHGWWEINEQMYCGSYMDHQTIFRVPSSLAHIQLHCSSRLSDKPLLVEYGSYNISQPCPVGSFRCSSGLCVPQTQRCDGVNDCFDESDELFCDTLFILLTLKPACNTSSLRQHGPLVCDGFRDCEDGRDEQNCTQMEERRDHLIASQQVHLPSSTECIPCNNRTFKCGNDICFRKQNAQCDGTVDCPDGSDEQGCKAAAGVSPPTTASLGEPTPRKGVGLGRSASTLWDLPTAEPRSSPGSGFFLRPIVSMETAALGDIPSVQMSHEGFQRLSDPTPWTAHLGMYVQGNAKFVSPVKRIVVHEYYNSQTFDYDIALLQLSTAWPETLKQLIQPICIPPAGQKVRGGEKCWVTGWGRRHEAGQAEVELIDQTLCVSTYGIITSRMLCAGVMSGKRDACREEIRVDLYLVEEKVMENGF